MTDPLKEISCRLFRPHILATWVFDRLFDRTLDKRFGIQSSKRFSLSSLGLVESPDCAGYQPISYLDFPRLIEKLEQRDGTLVDFGSGSGRCVCLASEYGFRKVIGVDFSESLCMMARRNIQSRGITNAEIECGDAATFAIPSDATTFVFNNPFRGQIMRTVLANIVRSANLNPRQVQILACGSPVDSSFFEQFKSAPGLKRAWQAVLPTGCLAMMFENDQLAG